MTANDPELEQWTAEWRQQGSARGDAAERAPAAIRDRVRRRSRRLVLLTAGERLLAAAAIVFLWRFARALGTPLDLFTLTAFAALAELAFAFSLWNRRGVWRPSAESTAAYLALERERCRRSRRSIQAGWVLLAVEVALFVPWIAHRLHAGARAPGLARYLAAYGYLAAVAGATAIVLLALARRRAREERELEAIQVSLEEEVPVLSWGSLERPSPLGGGGLGTGRG
jgi:hypothetical protein